MIPAQRQQKILDILSEHKIMSYARLCETLGVSHMTIRRDAATLKEMGRVVGVAGGIQLVSYLINEPSHHDKLTLSHKEKEHIANLAHQEITSHDHSIYLDAGTTCLAIAKRIATMPNRLLLTNDLKIADYLLQHSLNTVTFIGGEMSHQNCSSIGSMAADMLSHFNISLAFISTSSWNKKGISTPDIKKVNVKRQILQSSLRNILVGDSSKYGQRASYHIARLQNFEKVITDSSFSSSTIKLLERDNITVQNH